MHWSKVNNKASSYTPPQVEKIKSARKHTHWPAAQIDISFLISSDSRDIGSIWLSLVKKVWYSFKWLLSYSLNDEDIILYWNPQIKNRWMWNVKMRKIPIAIIRLSIGQVPENNVNICKHLCRWYSGAPLKLLTIRDC